MIWPKKALRLAKRLPCVKYNITYIRSDVLSQDRRFGMFKWTVPQWNDNNFYEMVTESTCLSPIVRRYCYDLFII